MHGRNNPLPPVVRELGRECAFTKPGADGRTRYKIKGRVFKGRKLTGDEAEWVVLDVVHQAAEVLKRVNDDPTHLFGTWIGEKMGYGLFSDVSLRLKNFQQHLNKLFGVQGPARTRAAHLSICPG